MKILITTLSIGENYTRDYTLRMIEDVILLTDVDIYITTDCKNIIIDKFGNLDRIKINEGNDNYKAFKTKNALFNLYQHYLKQGIILTNAL